MPEAVKNGYRLVRIMHGQVDFNEEGAVVGATHEAIQQISDKAIGLNVGGKIAVARYRGHITVCVFFAIGLLNLNDVSIGLGHRAVK